ncbi:MAG TPA: hypothetical protein VIP81_16560, partial [Chitinophaga sp.]
MIVVYIVTCFLSAPVITKAQTPGNRHVPEEDLSDFARRILHKKVDSAKVVEEKKAAILPSVGYNPSLGFVIGAKISGVKQLGNPGNTNLSFFGLEGLLTSKGIITLQARHNIFRAADKWNLQGNWQFSKFLIEDYGIGTGNKDYRTNSDSTFPIKFNYIRLSEQVYTKVGENLYVGVGITFNIRGKIDDEKLETLHSTPHQRYSLQNGFDTSRYSSNGLLLGLQFNTREHPLR